MAYDYVNVNEQKPNYEDLGLVIDGGAGGAGNAKAASAVAYSGYILNKEWTKHISILAKSTKAFDLNLERTDIDGNVLVTSISANHALSATYLLFASTAKPGEKFRIGIKNRHATDASNTYVKLTLLG